MNELDLFKKNNYSKKINIVKLEISKILNWILPRSLKLFFFTSINGLFKLNEEGNWIGSFSGIEIKFKNAFYFLPLFYQMNLLKGIDYTL